MICYIIDDEPDAIAFLERLVRQTPGLELSGSSTNPLTALPLYSGEQPPELTFLDIDLPQLSGLDLAGLIGNQTRVIFTTAYREFGPEAYEKNAAGYLLKPFTPAQFLACIQKLRERLPRPDFCFIRTGSKSTLTRILYQDIRYIAALLNYVEIHLANDKLITYIGINELEKLLPAPYFSRIHRSTIINRSHISKVETDEVTLTNGRQLTIGRSYRQAFSERLGAFLLGSQRT